MDDSSYFSSMKLNLTDLTRFQLYSRKREKLEEYIFSLYIDFIVGWFFHFTWKKKSLITRVYYRLFTPFIFADTREHWQHVHIPTKCLYPVILHKLGKIVFWPTKRRMWKNENKYDRRPNVMHHKFCDFCIIKSVIKFSLYILVSLI